MSIQLYFDDCFNIFPQLEDKSIDLVLCDMPYGTTACKWDTVIDLDRMWRELKRIVKDNTAIVLTASQPFTSILVCSNLNMYRYQWSWKKDGATGFANAKKQPLRCIEEILVFSKKPTRYYPQGLVRADKRVVNRKSTGGESLRADIINSQDKGALRTNGHAYIQEYSNYPKNILEIKRDRSKVHPTQKPVSLMEYLIKTYSNEGDTVLDFCMGSGTTGVACKNLNRNFIGIEKEQNYFEIATDRITSAGKGLTPA